MTDAEVFSQRVQWTPLLLVISIVSCENTHSVALGLTNGANHGCSLST